VGPVVKTSHDSHQLPTEEPPIIHLDVLPTHVVDN
jgi:hypothetical protein